VKYCRCLFYVSWDNLHLELLSDVCATNISGSNNYVAWTVKCICFISSYLAHTENVKCSHCINSINTVSKRRSIICFFNQNITPDGIFYNQRTVFIWRDRPSALRGNRDHKTVTNGLPEQNHHILALCVKCVHCIIYI